MTKADRNRIKALLTEAITVLCKNGLTYKDEFAIEGLLGITLDSSEVFLVSINETIKNELAEARESLRQQEAAAAQKLSSAGQRHTASPVKQVPHSVPVSRHATHSSPGSHQKNIPQPVSVYKNSKSGQYQQIHPSATRKRSVDESSQDVEEDLELHVQAVEQGEDQELDDLNETFQTEQSDSVISRLSDSASGEPPSKRAARDESYRTDSRSPAESGDSENESKYKPEEPDIIFVKQEVTDDTDENSSASQSRTRIPQSGEDPQPGCSNWDASNNQLNINSPTSFLPTPDQQQAQVEAETGTYGGQEESTMDGTPDTEKSTTQGQDLGADRSEDEGHQEEYSFVWDGQALATTTYGDQPSDPDTNTAPMLGLPSGDSSEYCEAEHPDICEERDTEGVVGVIQTTAMVKSLMPRKLSLEGERQGLATGAAPVTRNRLETGYGVTKHMPTSAIHMHTSAMQIVPRVRGFRRISENSETYSHKCHCCPAAFQRKGDLTRHIRSVHQKQQHTCPICRTVYTRIDNLNQHLKKKHDVFRVRTGRGTFFAQ